MAIFENKSERTIAFNVTRAVGLPLNNHITVKKGKSIDTKVEAKRINLDEEVVLEAARNQTEVNRRDHQLLGFITEVKSKKKPNLNEPEVVEPKTVDEVVKKN